MSNLNRERITPGEIARRLLPAGTVLLSLLVMALPLPLAWGVMPNLALLFVILWASIQPRLMPVWAGFLLGLFADLLFGGRIGIWALIFPLAVGVVRVAEERVEGHSLAVDWAFAALLVMLAQLLAWQLNSFLGSSAPLLPFLVQGAVTLIAYPLAATLGARTQRRLTDLGG
ncbi:rod shape-determining protein MreD [Sandaracinobacter neustonicus]|uniref:Rod shape-determining protein MreD n=1 Tax=Sandaracinobacter neustonicus TaxID=1715348 RepID=A0A501XJR5_9SPHN|nr:rod shape-determining protein MreD [Sandaracinobacter neustonicus]TPE60514.1 rod shape-determining protein MreD [Sandaracinobacter neustonicus]